MLSALMVLALSYETALATAWESVPTISDSITSTEIGSELPGAGQSSEIATFSPDGSRFAVVIHQGNLQTNTNDYSLLLYETNKAKTGDHHPRVLTRFASSRNEPGITNVVWLAGGRRILFLGARATAPAQIYSLDVLTRTVRQLTSENTDVTEFMPLDTLGANLIFKTRPKPRPIPLDRTGATVLGDQQMLDLMLGRTSDYTESDDLFVKRAGSAARKISLPFNVRLWRGLFPSPDGSHVLVLAYYREHDVPADWANETNFTGWANVYTFLSVDTRRYSSRLLIDAPAGEAFRGERVVWMPDGRSVIVNSYLPISHNAAAERNRGKVNPVEVEVSVQTGAMQSVASGYCVIDDWNTGSMVLSLVSPTKSELGASGDHICERGSASYRREGRRWKKVQLSFVQSPPNVTTKFTVHVEQGMNQPPQLIATNHHTGAKILLLDPNPKYRSIRLSTVRELPFEGTDGQIYTAGIYQPTKCSRGQKCPLVIQTHGWDPARFEFDGESTAGYAAQVLAAHGIVVAQLPGTHMLTSPDEGPRGMSEYEGIIDALASNGIIDPRRVGIQGWSRTCYTVRYMLAFSRKPIAAALLVDGIDAGYMSYLAFADLRNAKGDVTSEQINGGLPFGTGLQSWLRRAPTFNMEKVRAPVLQFMFGPNSIPAMWEFQAGLALLHRPAESIWLPNSNHWPTRPLERLAVQGGAVDWFRFWLQGYEDPSPTKREQYYRWEKLCGLQNIADLRSEKRCIPRIK